MDKYNGNEQNLELLDAMEIGFSFSSELFECRENSDVETQENAD